MLDRYLSAILTTNILIKLDILFNIDKIIVCKYNIVKYS